MIRLFSNVAISLVVFSWSVGRSSAGRRRGARRLEDTLERIGDNGVPNTTFPLLKCKGDCDGYDDCVGDLRCYFRRYTEDDGPPGCQGEIMDGTDICFDPADDPSLPPLGMLYRLAQDGEPSWAFPLRKCQGDCDGDEDCLEGLKCFKRKLGNESDIGPPGCSGDAAGTADFCYDPNDVGYDPNDEEDDARDDETKTMGGGAQTLTNEEESSSRSKKEKLTISVVVVGVVLLLIVGFWLSKRRTKENGATTAQAGEAILDGPPSTASIGKEHETESDEEPATSTT